MTNPSDTNPAFVVPDHRATELHLFASGAHWTILRNAIYTEMYLGSAPGAIASGTLVTNAGDGRAVNVSRAGLRGRRRRRSWPTTRTRTSSTTSPARRRSTPRAWRRSTASSRASRSRSGSSTTTPGSRRCPAVMPEAAARAYATLGRAQRLGYQGFSLDRGPRHHRPRATFAARGARSRRSPADEVVRVCGVFARGVANAPAGPKMRDSRTSSRLQWRNSEFAFCRRFFKAAAAAPAVARPTKFCPTRGAIFPVQI